MYEIVYNLSMKKNRGYIKDFNLYMLGLRRYNPHKQPDRQVKFRKRPSDIMPELTEISPAFEYSALRDNAYALRQELFLERIKRLAGPDRRRLLFGLAFIEGYTIIGNSLEPAGHSQER